MVTQVLEQELHTFSVKDQISILDFAVQPAKLRLNNARLRGTLFSPVCLGQSFQGSGHALCPVAIRWRLFPEEDGPGNL